ncbi:MAG TPA: LEA type 2 family protein [Nitrosospira sp.]|nr:LEA type 2 family protein [Nitrosospira sp.]
MFPTLAVEIISSYGKYSGYYSEFKMVDPMHSRAPLILGLFFILSGCAFMGLHAPLRVSVAGMEPLEGKGMEARFAVAIRIQNHGGTPIDYDGIALDMDLQGMSFASGVSDQRGTIPRFGESVITVPVTVPATAILRHIYGFATGDRAKVDYRLQGKLGVPGLSPGKYFDSSGEITLPAMPPEPPS